MFPLTLELYDGNNLQYLPPFRKLRFAKTFFGGEDLWMTFVLDRPSDIDYPDVAYGNDAVLREGLTPRFVGEIRNIEQDLETCVVKVLGNFVFLDDYSYGDKGKLWADTRYGKWEPVTEDMQVARRPERFRMDVQGRLFIAPVRDELFSNAGAYGDLYYYCPYDEVKRVTFNYDFVDPGNWEIHLMSNNGTPGAWGAENSEWSLAATAAGAANITFANARALIHFRLFYNAGAARYAGETGETCFIEIKNLVLYGSTDVTPTSSDVAEDIVDEMVAAGTPISSDKRLIETIALVFTPLAFEYGETCHDALKTAAFYGDAQHKLLGWGVEGGGTRVFIRKPDFSEVRYVVHPSDAKRILLRGMAHRDFLTEGWGKYHDEDGLTQYTAKYYAHVTPTGIDATTVATGDDLASTVFGVKRSAPVDFGPMTPAMAVDAIQQYLIERAHPLITSSVEVFYAVRDMFRGGMEIHPAEMEMGYLVQIPRFRAVDPVGAAISDIRWGEKVQWDTTFLLIALQHDDERGSTRLFPEEAEEDLARLLSYVRAMEV